MMMRRSASFLLLILTGCGLMAGPHPCHAMRPAQETAAPPCHAQPSANSTSGGNSQVSPGILDCCNGGNSRLCESTCQMTAVFDARLSLFAVRPVSPAIQPVLDRSLPLFAHTIDHVPLA